MQKVLFIFFLSLLILGCGSLTESTDPLGIGSASIEIEGESCSGYSYFTTEKIGEFNFKTIVIDIDDSTRIEIQKESFDEGIYTLGLYENLIVTVTYRYESFHYAEKGFLFLKTVNSYQIIGEFNMVTRNAISSCSNCPEDRMFVRGKFNAIIP